ncbi:MAG: hypothetical protein ACOYYS_03545 [Chloroflexota bacterium]
MLEKIRSSLSQGFRQKNRSLTLVSVAVVLALIATIAFGTLARAQETGESPDIEVITWETQQVTNTKLFSWMDDRSLRLDGAGNAHIAYGGDHLYYASYNGSTWSSEVVDNANGVGLYASLALDSNNRPHISYYDAATGSLKYARNVGSGWEIYVLDTPAMANAYEFAESEHPSLDGLAVRSVDVREVIAIMENTHGFTQLEAIMQMAAVLQGRGLFTSITVDAANDPHIAYYDAINGDLKYAHKVYTGWRIDSIDTEGDVGQYTSIAIAKDSNNKVFTHFSFYDVTHMDLRYARWSAETSSVAERRSIDGTSDADVGKYSSIALTVEDTPKPRISYYYDTNSTNSYLKYAIFKNGDTWELQTVTATNAKNGQFTSLALDKNNNPHISYLNETSGMVKIGMSTGGGWNLVDVAQARGTRIYSSIAVDKNTTDTDADARISFFNADTGELKFARQTGANAWNISTVDTSTNMGAYNALAMDSSGNPHITFYDDTHDRLYYVRWAGTTWSTPSAIQNGGGPYSDIAIGAGSVPHVAYYDYARECLRYATWATDHWFAEDVECDKKGKFASIDMDNLNRPHIAYYDEKNGDLKWAYKDGGTWHVRFVDGTGEDVGQYSSIAIDSSNLPHFSYYDVTHKALRYARLQSDGATWHIEYQVDAQAGMFSQIALDNQGLPHIAYFDDAEEDVLKHAWKSDLSSTAWGQETVDENNGILGGEPRPPLVPLSIATDNNGGVHFSYYDYADKILRYARKLNNIWVRQVVDSSGDVGQYSSIAVNAAGQAGISFYDATNGDLKYTKSQTVNYPYAVFLPMIKR